MPLYSYPELFVVRLIVLDHPSVFAVEHEDHWVYLLMSDVTILWYISYPFREGFSTENLYML